MILKNCTDNNNDGNVCKEKSIEFSFWGVSLFVFVFFFFSNVDTILNCRTSTGLSVWRKEVVQTKLLADVRSDIFILWQRKTIHRTFLKTTRQQSFQFSLQFHSSENISWQWHDEKRWKMSCLVVLTWFNESGLFTRKNICNSLTSIQPPNKEFLNVYLVHIHLLNYHWFWHRSCSALMIFFSWISGSIIIGTVSRHSNLRLSIGRVGGIFITHHLRHLLRLKV